MRVQKERAVGTAPFAKAAEVEAGSVLKADGGFTCLRAGAERPVEQDDGGLFIRCRSGKHYLDGQRERTARGVVLVGLALVRPAQEA